MATPFFLFFRPKVMTPSLISFSWDPHPHYQQICHSAFKIHQESDYFLSFPPLSKSLTPLAWIFSVVLRSLPTSPLLLWSVLHSRSAQKPLTALSWSKIQFPYQALQGPAWAVVRLLLRPQLHTQLPKTPLLRVFVHAIPSAWMLFLVFHSHNSFGSLLKYPPHQKGLL